MPSRLLREGILTSERVDALDWPAEVFYRRLMSKVDDHGLYDARPSVLRSSLFPLRVDRVREADISRWLVACEAAGLIVLYVIDGKPLMQMQDTRWTARSEPKFPLPPSSLPMNATENSCKQLRTPVTLDVVVVGDVVKRMVPPSLPDGFMRFWGCYPTTRRNDRAKSVALWRKHSLEAMAGVIAAHVAAMVQTPQWRDGVIPNATTYLNQRRWEAGLPQAPMKRLAT